MTQASSGSILKWLDENLEALAITVLLLGMTFLVGLQVIMRYLFHSSLSWSEELARYFFIWMIYLGISYGVKKNRHISIDVLHNILPPRWAALLSMLADLIFLGFALIVVFYGQNIVSRVLLSTQNSPALEIPMWVIYSAVPTGFALVSLRLVQSLIFKGRLLIKKDFEHIP